MVTCFNLVCGKVRWNNIHNYDVIYNLVRWSNGVSCKMLCYASSSRASRGRKFQTKKNYIVKKGFAYRMCVRRPTSGMPKPFLCCKWAFCSSMVVMSPLLMYVMSFDVVVMSFNAMWLLVLCHITWYNAMCAHVIWCDVIACVVSCHVMQCVFEMVLWQCGNPQCYFVL